MKISEYVLYLFNRIVWITNSEFNFNPDNKPSSPGEIGFFLKIKCHLCINNQFLEDIKSCALDSCAEKKLIKLHSNVTLMSRYKINYLTQLRYLYLDIRK